MSRSPAARLVAIVTACMTQAGLPHLALTEVSVTQDEAENGVQYTLAEQQLLRNGYEEPFVHFAEAEAPAFLHVAVRKHLGLMAANRTVDHSSCP